jgi:superfamily I DNA/RNA helicase
MLRSKIDMTHFIFDECQDMTQRKYEIVKILKDNRRIIFAVGDIKQKINGFSEPIKKFEDIAIFKLFEKDIKLRLTTSFRTNNNILMQTNKIFRTNTKSNDSLNNANYSLLKIEEANEDKIIDYYKLKLKNKYKTNHIKILCRTKKQVYSINSRLLSFDDESVV